MAPPISTFPLSPRAARRNIDKSLSKKTSSAGCLEALASTGCLVAGGVVCELSTVDWEELVTTTPQNPSRPAEAPSSTTSLSRDAIENSVWTKRNSGCLVKGGVVVDCEPLTTSSADTAIKKPPQPSGAKAISPDLDDDEPDAPSGCLQEGGVVVEFAVEAAPLQQDVF